VYEEPLIDIRKVLEPLSKSCLYRLTGWWTYEFCYGKHIRQFHQMEKDHSIRPQDEFFLGRRFPENSILEANEAEMQQESEESTDLSVESEAMSTNRRIGSRREFYSETYTDGTPCDLTGVPRRAEVRYFCTESGSSSIVDVKEPSSCQYLVTVGTPLLCKHSAFVPRHPKTVNIPCLPVESPENRALNAVSLRNHNSNSSLEDNEEKEEKENSIHMQDRNDHPLHEQGEQIPNDE